ncbi:HypC/HybG/HupF family hydrogenase formation chaperone [Paramagnetospirillum kuznetsovii]|uniref:Hydrogenase maturation factor HypC n=1 Tax=Paramagnetospirillum kuznetsovii TaxID=2053833 RepID=A0A364NUG9_9PROT|nr:HypC/HybG/HupF family hydrogenase formation chaperone [Paramagnetospirillum kuznetsovii]RAU20660.1 HypC/HybG/HupF family hydrogenase formation chaperone [Paramagnetospirillum kuznetsovii]
MCLALPSLVTELLADDNAKVNLGGVTKTVSLALVSDVKVGDYVIVHVGYALSVIDPEEAAQTLALFREMEQAEPAQ